MSRLVVLLLALCLTSFHASAIAETTVTPDPLTGAIIIEGVKPGSSKAGSDEEYCCIEYVLVPQEGVLPADSLVARRCRDNPVTLARVSDDLRERVVRYLPPQRPRIWPSSTALVNLPIVAASGQRPVRLYARVLGERVTIDLAPTFRWRWGDGSVLVTSQAGRPYPATTITHVYRRAGQRTVHMVTSWSGSWSFGDGSTHPLGAVLTQTARRPLQVREAPIRLTR
jgi:hypothetical protein